MQERNSGSDEAAFIDRLIALHDSSTLPIVDYGTFIPMVGATYFSLSISSTISEPLAAKMIANLVSRSLVALSSYIEVDFDGASYTWAVQERSGYDTAAYVISLYISKDRCKLFIKFQRVHGNSEIFHRAVRRFTDQDAVQGLLSSVSARTMKEAPLYTRSPPSSPTNSSCTSRPHKVQRRFGISLSAPPLPLSLVGHLPPLPPIGLDDFKRYMQSMLHYLECEPIEALRVLRGTIPKMVSDLRELELELGDRPVPVEVRRLVLLLSSLVVACAGALPLSAMKDEIFAFDSSGIATDDTSQRWEGDFQGCDQFSGCEFTSAVPQTDISVSVYRSVGGVDVWGGQHSQLFSASVFTMNGFSTSTSGTVEQKSALGATSKPNIFDAHEENIVQSSLSLDEAPVELLTSGLLPDFYSQHEIVVCLRLALFCLDQLRTLPGVPVAVAAELKKCCSCPEMAGALRSVAAENALLQAGEGRSLMTIRGEAEVFCAGVADAGSKAPIVPLSVQIVDECTCSLAKALVV